MSLSLTMIASISVGERWWRFAEVATASAIRPHCDGVQAGVCQRIFSFTAQIVCARQLLAWTSPPASVSPSVAGTAAGLGGEVAASGGDPARAKQGAKLNKAVAVPKDKDSFRKSANTASPLSLKRCRRSVDDPGIGAVADCPRCGGKGLIRSPANARALSKKSSSFCGVERNVDCKKQSGPCRDLFAASSH